MVMHQAIHHLSGFIVDPVRVVFPQLLSGIPYRCLACGIFRYSPGLHIFNAEYVKMIWVLLVLPELVRGRLRNLYRNMN